MRRQLRLFNTISLRKEEFKPATQGSVKMFVCGPTVQGPMHVGHARTYVFYDVLARYLEQMGNKVNFLMNITDIDEKITEAAKTTGRHPTELASHYKRAFISDMARLGINSAKYEPVSRYIPQMIEQVQKLLDTGHAYEADGSVYFDTSTFPRYGQLSHLSLAELTLRPLELSLRKKNLIDFTLWRPVSLIPGKWPSPWGTGSPGWHIQDTALTIALFGSHYDIHGGAYELIYPHHEAEIAQAESLTGFSPFVRYWVHTGLVNMKGEKMSKSKGNLVAVSDVMKRMRPGELRLLLLGQHYRQDLDFTDLGAAKSTFMKMKKTVSGLNPRHVAEINPSDLGDILERFYDRMDDDLDTPGAISALCALAISHKSDRDACRAVAWAANRILGVNLFDTKSTD